MQDDFYKQVMADSVQAYLKDIQLNAQSIPADFYDLVMGNMYAHVKNTGDNTHLQALQTEKDNNTQLTLAYESLSEQFNKIQELAATYIEENSARSAQLAPLLWLDRTHYNIVAISVSVFSEKLMTILNEKQA